MMKMFLTIIFTLLLFHSSYSENQSPADSIRAVQSYRNATSLIRNGFYTEAIDTLKKSAALRKKLYSKDSYEYGIIQNALGIVYKNLGNFEKSLEHFLSAETSYVSNESKNELAIARLYNNIGNVYKSKMNYGTAIDYFHRAITIFLKEKEVNFQNIADFYYNIADIKYRQQKYQEALEIIEKYNAQAYPDTKIYFFSLQAVIYQAINDYPKAYQSHRKTVKLAEGYYSKTNPNIIYDYLNFATFLIAYDQFEEAKEVLQNTHAVLSGNKIEEGTGLAFYYKTAGYLQENLIVETKDLEAFRRLKSAHLAQAISYYKKSLESLGMELNELPAVSSSLSATLSLTQSLELLKGIADVYTQIAEIYSSATDQKGIAAMNHALDYYQVTVDLIQQARKEIYSDENKIQLGELEEATFNKIVQTAWKANRLSPRTEVTEFAFSTAERKKASSVFDHLSDQLARENSLIPDSLTERERTLNYNITSLNEKLYRLRHEEQQDEKEIARNDSALFQLKKQREELNQYMETNFGDYYEMKYANSMVSLKEIQQKLSSNEVAIEYILNETDSIPEVYAFFFSAEHTGFYKLDTDSAFIPSLERTFRFVSNPAYLFTHNDNSRAFCLSAHYLYQKLVQPFEQYLHNKKITIIPDGKLSYLPFEALLTEEPDTAGLVQFNLLPYLIRSHAINYSYSANLLFKFEKQKKQVKNRLLAFAPEYHSDTVRVDNERLVLVPLPGIRREVDLIAKEVKTRLYSGSQATEANFRKECKNYDILHLAMHAFINDSLPAFSRFAFAQNEEKSSTDDGWLNTADIYNLALNARLTVLSACNTGQGHLRKGEGIMSLARGFLYAGCPSIIMSLWEVEDNAGTEIMHSFYQTLKKGRNTDDALRQAKLHYLENANPRLAHPHYWLGYVSIGNTTPLFRSYDYYFFGLLILALAGLTADQIIHFRKSGKRFNKRK